MLQAIRKAYRKPRKAQPVGVVNPVAVARYRRLQAEGRL